MNRKSKYIVPNLFTGLSFLIGIFSTLVAATFYHQNPGEMTFIGKAPIIMSAWMIIWCVMFDKLDGFAAKIMNASSEFGAQFDSLTDLIAFGVAPGFLMYFFMKQNLPVWSSEHRVLLFVSLSLYVLCTAMRLARYNSKDSEELGDYFSGLPSTFAGGLVAIAVINLDKHEAISISPYFNYTLPLLLIFLGLLMVSPLYLPKLVIRKKSWVNYVQIPATALGYIFSFGMIFPEYLLTVLTLYGVIGFSYCLIKRESLTVELVKNEA